jgi:hypothetical protein
MTMLEQSGVQMEDYAYVTIATFPFKSCCCTFGAEGRYSAMVSFAVKVDFYCFSRTASLPSSRFTREQQS